MDFAEIVGLANQLRQQAIRQCRNFVRPCATHAHEVASSTDIQIDNIPTCWS